MPAVVEPVGILGRIVAAKRGEVAQRFAAVSIDALGQSATPSELSLTRALAEPGARFILEIKRASPSSGMIRRAADPAAIARGYGGVADALSVLCDNAFFGGSLDDLTLARKAFDGPILAKDFFIDRRQVVEARIAGADAVLVMLSVLDDAEARGLIEEARSFGMDALVEVHDDREMARALALGAPLIGINNRDLRDLSIDLSTTERLAPMAPGRILVSESGIGSRSDVERLARQVDAFLVGSSLMSAADPAMAAREMVFGCVKLCGLNCGADIGVARPAAFAGFVFVTDSPRRVTIAEAAPLAGTARRQGTLPVGVFRNSDLKSVIDTALQLDLHAVQFHGAEDVDYVREARRRLTESCEIWTSASVGREPLSGRGGDRIVFDNGDGGTGSPFDWSLIDGHPDLPRALVAGGLGPGNARAARQLGAYAMDIGSAVDEAPGRKSPGKIAALFDVLRPSSRIEMRACA